MPGLEKCSPTVVALEGAVIDLDRLRRAFGDSLVCTKTVAEFHGWCRRAHIEIAIVPAYDVEGLPLTKALAALPTGADAVAVYVYADRSAHALRALMPLAMAGARNIILRDVDDDPHSLRRLLLQGDVENVVETLASLTRAALPEPLRVTVVSCLLHVTKPLTATSLATMLGVSRRTLTNRAHGLGARGVRSLNARCRVLVALGLLDMPNRSVERVALHLDFASSAQLYNMTRRYTGMLPKDAAPLGLHHWFGELLLRPSAAVRLSDACETLRTRRLRA